jgi:hypothetical protein
MNTTKFIIICVLAVIVSFFLSCNKQADENLINEDIQTSDYILSDEDAKILLSDFVAHLQNPVFLSPHS